MTARVRGVMTRSIAAGSMLRVAGSRSANTGLAPARTTALAQETNVKLGSTTSSPGPTPESRTDASSAELHELRNSGRAPSRCVASAASATRAAGPPPISRLARTACAAASASASPIHGRVNGKRERRTGAPPSMASATDSSVDLRPESIGNRSAVRRRNRRNYTRRWHSLRSRRGRAHFADRGSGRLPSVAGKGRSLRSR